MGPLTMSLIAILLVVLFIVLYLLGINQEQKLIQTFKDFYLLIEVNIRVPCLKINFILNVMKLLMY